MLFKILPVCVLFLVLSSCKTIDIAAPTLSSADSSILVLPPSQINIPVEIDLSSQLKDVEKSLPKQFEGKQEQCEGVSFSYKFIREPIDFQLKTNSLYYEVDGKFELKLNYCPKCHELWDEKGSCTVPRIYASCGYGEPMRKVKVAYATNVSITEAYRFNTTTKLKKFDVLDPCEITVFKYDATSQVEKQVRVQLEALEKDIDKQIEDVDIRSSLQDVWKQLEEPMDLSGYGLLYLHPKSMALSPVSFENNGKKASLNALLTVQPLISTNSIEQHHTPLPNQSVYKSGDGFQLAISVKASYDSINKLMNQSIKGMDIPFHNKHIVIDSLHVLGQQNQNLLVEVHFSGSKKGVFYLVGKPYITPDEHFVMTDVTYDLNSKSVLLKTAKWMFDKRILEELRKAADYDLNPLLQETKVSINQQLNTTLAAGVFLSGKVDQLTVSNIILGATDFYLMTLVSGDMKLKMK
jgi:hypothetical protein